MTSALKIQINSNQKEFNQLNGNITELDSEINQLKREASSKQKESSILEQKMNKKDEELSNLNSEMKRINNQLEKTTKNLDIAEKEKDTLSAQLEEQKRIASEFARSYKTELQKNKQLERDVNFNQKDINISTEKTKKATIYRVQIGRFNQEMEFDDLENLISIPTKDGQHIYMTQKFNTYSQAKTRLIEINQLGYTDAYIVKF